MARQEGGSLEVVIEAQSADYDASDERWIDQVGQLHDDLQRGAGDVRKEVVPQQGRKGGAEAVILALGSAGAITAAAEMFKAWLARDRGRGLKLTIKRGGETEEFEITGEGMHASVIEKFMNAALDRGDA